MENYGDCLDWRLEVGRAGCEPGWRLVWSLPRGKLTLSPTDTGRLLSSLASVSLSVKWEDSDDDTISTP